MNKRSFLIPLSVSVAALLGSVPRSASASVTTPHVLAMPAVPRPAAADFVLERSAEAPIQLAQHFSHTSHASHASHRSHSSGY